MLHRDAFDRIQIAQASVEGMMLVTKDAMVLRYTAGVKRAMDVGLKAPSLVVGLRAIAYENRSCRG